MFKTMKEQGVSRETVRKYIAMEKPAKYSREGRQSVIAPYTDYVKGRIDKHNLSAVRIYEEIRDLLMILFVNCSEVRETLHPCISLYRGIMQHTRRYIIK